MQQKLVSAKRTPTPSTPNNVRQDLDDITEAAISVDATSNPFQEKVAPRGKKRKAPGRLPVDRAGKRLGSKSAQKGFKGTIFDQQTSELKQFCQDCEARNAKMATELSEHLLQIKDVIKTQFQSLREEESEKAKMKLANAGLSKQVQNLKLHVIELQKKLDDKESPQTVETVASNRDESILPFNSDLRTMVQSGSKVHGYEDGYIRNMRANTATQPHLQNGIRGSESSYPQQTSVSSSMNKTYKFVYAK